MTRTNYSSLTLRTPSGCELELLPAAGGLTNRLRLCAGNRAFDVIEGFANRRAIADDVIYRGVPLFPIINRLDGGRYNHRGQSYQLTVNETARNNTLHGFLTSLTPQVTVHEDEAASVAALTFRYDGQYSGYPFAAHVQFEFILSDDTGLQLTMSVTNLHDQPIPVGIGWHPYFSLDQKVDTLALQLPTVKQTLVDERMLPTGAQAEYEAFAQPNIIGSTEFDDCFAVQAAQERTVTTRLWSEQQSIGLEIWQQTGDGGLNHLQVCTAPDRRSIAIEPVSCGINAFNTGEGLVILEPNQQLCTRTGVRLLAQKPTAL